MSKYRDLLTGDMKPEPPPDEIVVRAKYSVIDFWSVRSKGRFVGTKSNQLLAGKNDPMLDRLCMENNWTSDTHEIELTIKVKKKSK